MPDVRIRPLRNFDELSQGVELQRQTWGARFDDVVSAALMLVAQKIGGVAAGAFDAHERLLGMIFGLTGIRNDRRVHWSHMLAVVPDRQGRGLGRLLKLYQRERVRRLGIRSMYWTFDPLEARNAHFNLNVLGVEVEEYVIDMYGLGESSPLHRGIGTDRFVVRWNLDVVGPAAAPGAESSAFHSGALSWEDDEATAELPFEPAAPSARFTSPDSDAAEAPRVEIPPDIQRLKAANPAEAMEWRTATRAAFTHYLAQGRRPTRFVHDPQTGSRYYLIESVPDRSNDPGGLESAPGGPDSAPDTGAPS